MARSVLFVVAGGRTPFVLDLVADYQNESEMSLELDADLTSEAGESLHVATIGSEDEGGAEWAEHCQSEPAMTRADGRWSGHVVLHTTGVRFSAATAALRLSPLDLAWLRTLLALVGSLALVVAFLTRRSDALLGPTAEEQRAASARAAELEATQPSEPRLRALVDAITVARACTREPQKDGRTLVRVEREDGSKQLTFLKADEVTTVARALAARGKPWSS